MNSYTRTRTATIYTRIAITYNPYASSAFLESIWLESYERVFRARTIG